MIRAFTILQQKAIEEKVKQLRKVKDGTLTAKELAEIITRRRLSWLDENIRPYSEFCVGGLKLIR